MKGRRGLLGGLTVLTVAPATIPAVVAMAVHPDAELIAMGREATPLIEDYERFTAEWQALPSGHPDSNRMADLATPASDRLDELLDRAVEMQATTVEGFRAKARILQHEMRCMNRIAGKISFATPGEDLAWSLACDMLAAGEAA